MATDPFFQLPVILPNFSNLGKNLSCWVSASGWWFDNFAGALFLLCYFSEFYRPFFPFSLNISVSDWSWKFFWLFLFCAGRMEGKPFFVTWRLIGVYFGAFLLGQQCPDDKRKMCSFQGIDLAKQWSFFGLRIWSDFPASLKQREKPPTAMQIHSPVLDPPQRSHATLLISLCPFITADLITASTWGL